MNREITAQTLRLVGADGSQIGVVSLREALELAEEANMDLAEIAPSAQPPVAKILDWGKYKYEQTKQLQKAKKHQKQVEVKQVRLGLKIGDHDLQVKLNRARKFLEDGHKVKISLLFRGREISRPQLGHDILTKVMEQLSDVATQEQAPILSGRDLNMIIGMKKDAKA
ncbi:MAG TPA: translation initiation factor IF-3 [Candidatus Saccharimonas sp.]|nr:translation initiation factor IF-3 [Candidatus Saccharimonas sp.]